MTTTLEYVGRAEVFSSCAFLETRDKEHVTICNKDVVELVDRLGKPDGRADIAILVMSLADYEAWKQDRLKQRESLPAVLSIDYDELAAEEQAAGEQDEPGIIWKAFRGNWLFICLAILILIFAPAPLYIGMTLGTIFFYAFMAIFIWLNDGGTDEIKELIFACWQLIKHTYSNIWEGITGRVAHTRQNDENIDADDLNTTPTTYTWKNEKVDNDEWRIRYRADIEKRRRELLFHLKAVSEGLTFQPAGVSFSEDKAGIPRVYTVYFWVLVRGKSTTKTVEFVSYPWGEWRINTAPRSEDGGKEIPIQAPSWASVCLLLSHYKSR